MRYPFGFDADCRSFHFRSIILPIALPAPADALALNPPIPENVRFGDRIELRARSVRRTAMEATVQIWRKQMAAMKEHDRVLFGRSIDGQGKMLRDCCLPLGIRDQSLRDGAIRFDPITFSSPSPRDIGSFGYRLRPTWPRPAHRWQGCRRLERHQGHHPCAIDQSPRSSSDRDHR